jgi:hypothetical protein
MADNQSSLDLQNSETLIKNSMVCRLGIHNGKAPYVVPLSFGYRDNTLYFHSGPKGKKLPLLKDDPNVCFEFDRISEVMEADNPCSWDMKYQSIMGTGRVKFIEKTEDKIKALKIIISQYTDRPMNIPENKAESTVVFQVGIDNMTFKQGPV